MRTIAFAALLAAALAPFPAEAAGAGFDPRIVTFGDAREQIKSTPITQRPNRPLHVYGNTVRRRSQRAVAPAVVRPTRSSVRR
jgi:hypothetical protein